MLGKSSIRDRKRSFCVPFGGLGGVSDGCRCTLRRTFHTARRGAGACKDPAFLTSEKTPSEQRESGDAHQREGSGQGDGKDADHEYQALYLRSVVEAREGFVRLFDAKELAQRSPTFLHLVDQQPPSRDAPPNLLVVPVKDLHGVTFVLELPLEGATICSATCQGLMVNVPNLRRERSARPTREKGERPLSLVSS